MTTTAPGYPAPAAGAASRPRTWGRRTRLLVAAGIAAVWLVWAVTTWQVQARPVSAAQLRADVAATDVTGYLLTRGVEETERGWLPGTTDLRTPGDGRHGGIVLYRTTSGTLRYVVGIRQFDPSDVRGGYGGVGGTALSRDLAATLDGAGVPHVSAFSRSDWPESTAGLLTTTALVLLVLAPTPTRGTRWFWFWLVLFTPCGAGLVGYAAAELVIPVADGRPRLPGVAGAALGMAAALVVVGIGIALRAWLGTAAVPG